MNALARQVCFGRRAGGDRRHPISAGDVPAARTETPLPPGRPPQPARRHAAGAGCGRADYQRWGRGGVARRLAASAGLRGGRAGGVRWGRRGASGMRGARADGVIGWRRCAPPYTRKAPGSEDPGAPGSARSRSHHPCGSVRCRQWLTVQLRKLVRFAALSVWSTKRRPAPFPPLASQSQVMV